MPVGKNKGGSHKLTDPRKKLASTANKEARTHKVKTTRGNEVSVRKSAVDSAKAGKGAFKPATKYKGKAILNKDGKMSGYKTNDGKYTRTSTIVSRKDGAKKLAYDKKLHDAASKKRTNRNKRFAEGKKS